MRNTRSLRQRSTSSIRAVHGSVLTTSTGSSRPRAPLISRRASKSAERPSTPKAISHHRPCRSIGPIIPGVCRLSSHVWTAGGCGAAVTSSWLRNTTPVLGRSAVDPTYRAPICSRTTLRAPSAPATYSAVTGTAFPAGSQRVARTGPGPVVSRLCSRQPSRRSTAGSSVTTSRSTSSSTYCGICCPRSGESPSSASPSTPVNRVISSPRKLVQKETSCDQETGSGAAARSRSASPHRRACSMVRVFSVLARGRNRVGCGRGSTTRHSTPRRPSSTASARPTGPAPAISTGVSRVLDGSVMRRGQPDHAVPCTPGRIPAASGPGPPPSGGDRSNGRCRAGPGRTQER